MITSIYGQYKTFVIPWVYSLTHLITETRKHVLKRFKMLRRHYPVSYKHIMVSDSETESDDNINSLTVRENRRSNKTEKGDKFLSSTDPVAKPLNSKANVDQGQQNLYAHFAKKFDIYFTINIFFLTIIMSSKDFELLHVELEFNWLKYLFRPCKYSEFHFQPYKKICLFIVLEMSRVCSTLVLVPTIDIRYKNIDMANKSSSGLAT